MKPKHARKNIEKIFDKYYDGEVDSVMELIPELRENMPSLIRMRDKFKQTENDNRPGAETYGFDHNSERLCYISDRWQCRFRTQWMIDMLNHLDEGEENEDSV